MADSALNLISPFVAPTSKSEAELFGAMVWLWMQSPAHRLCPIADLDRLLLPALKTGQFVLALQDDELQQPAGLVTWARFSAETEQRYLQSLDKTMQPSDWRSGDRPWILDWVVPLGHTRAMAAALRRLYANSSFRGLYHRGDQTGLKVIYFKGKSVSKAQEADYWALRPLPQLQN